MNSDSRGCTAHVITVGSELLSGKVVNTNATYLARELTKMGISVVRITVLPDEIDEIAEEIRSYLGRVRLIVLTGGLGPTYDDVTAEAIAKSLGVPVVENEEAMEMIRAFYSKKGLSITEYRAKMAMLPMGSQPLKNKVGSAPGIFLKAKGTVIVALPGVPFEMKSMFEEVRRRIEEECGLAHVVEEELKVEGVLESQIAGIIEKVASLDRDLYVKSMAGGKRIIVYVKAVSTSKEGAKALLDRTLLLLRKGILRVGGRIIEDEESGS